MQIIKTEKIILSEAESKAWDLMVACLEGILGITEDPDIITHTNQALDGLSDLADYLED